MRPQQIEIRAIFFFVIAQAKGIVYKKNYIRSPYSSWRATYIQLSTEAVEATHAATVYTERLVNPLATNTHT